MTNHQDNVASSGNSKAANDSMDGKIKIDTQSISTKESARSPASNSSESASNLPFQNVPKQNKRKFYGCSNFGDFDLKEKVGEGTFGEVHKAINFKAKKDSLFALKRIFLRAEQEGVIIAIIFL